MAQYTAYLLPNNVHKNSTYFNKSSLAQYCGN